MLVEDPEFGGDAGMLELLGWVDERF